MARAAYGDKLALRTAGRGREGVPTPERRPIKHHLPSELRSRIRLIHSPDSVETASSVLAALQEGEVLRP
jgi:hypothetical protein